MIGYFFILWGIYVFAYGIYSTVKNSPGNDGVAWFFAFLNMVGGIMFAVSGYLLTTCSLPPAAVVGGNLMKKLLRW